MNRSVHLRDSPAGRRSWWWWWWCGGGVGPVVAWARWWCGAGGGAGAVVARARWWRGAGGGVSPVVVWGRWWRKPGGGVGPVVVAVEMNTEVIIAARADARSYAWADKPLSALSLHRVKADMRVAGFVWRRNRHTVRPICRSQRRPCRHAAGPRPHAHVDALCALSLTKERCHVRRTETGRTRP